MTDYTLLIPALSSFLITLFLMPFWIRKAKELGLLWEDMNKTTKEKVAGSGGIIVVLGFIISVLVFVAYRTFVLMNNEHLIEIFALLLVISILAGIGLIDDLFGWQKGGLSRRSRIIAVAISSIPLMVINAGKHTVSIPFLGHIDTGIFYHLTLIPLGIRGATTTFNFLAGFNGLEAGQGIILLSGASLVAYLTGSSWLSIIGLCMILALFSFLIFNFNPSRVFPGDSLTYTVGGLFATIAILGNFEKIAVFFFIPYIIETILKSRGKLVKASFGKPNALGSLDLKYDKIYGLTHLSIYILKKIGIKSTENNTVYLIWIFQILIIILGFIIFRNGIF